MFRLLVLVLLVIGMGVGAGRAQTEDLTPIKPGGVVICPASSSSEAMPDFAGPNCLETNKYDLDPQGAFIWVRAEFDLKQTRGTNGEPLSVYLSGKMSARVFLNGVEIGQNGTPAKSKQDEVPGLMDAVLHPPHDLLKTGKNELVLLASGHHGLLQLRHPVHFIGVGPTGNRTLNILNYYWPSLLTLGLFALGLLYFGVVSVIGTQRKTAMTFALICGFAGAQLIAEVSRGLIAYTYPMHDLRLILIAAFSACFGLSVSYHVVSRLMPQRFAIWLGIGALLSGCALILAGGWDLKAAYAMILPLLVSLCVAGYYSYLRRPRAFIYFLILLIFVAAIWSRPSLFLDVLFFYLVAALLLALMVEQAVTLAREQVLRHHEQARANRLELALEQVRQREASSEISVKMAGRIERISTEHIVQCRGAGGYSELCLNDGRELLHSATLAELEDSLPATFIRVHRSHLVNTAYIQNLKRDPAGTGTLLLSDGSEVAVSRRIMPSVRQVLA